MRAVVLGAALALGVVGEAEASEWINFGRGETGSVLYIDISSVKRLAPIDIWRPFPVIQAWVKYDSRQDRTVAESERVNLTNVNCDGRTLLTISSVPYMPNGTTGQSSSKRDADHNYKPVVPDTMGETIWEVLCGHRQFSRSQ